MIRTAYPTPPVRQLRLRLELATRRTRRALFERCRTLRSRPVEETKGHGSYAAYLREREAIRRNRAMYDMFEKQFDGLVGVVCFAAQEGITSDAETEFARYRAWFMEYYHRVRPYLAPYLTLHENDVTPTRWGLRRCDTFEALFLPASIQALLDADNGCLIDRLDRAQNAVTDWYNAVRHEERA
ncbi:MAG: hypothetical protein SFU56_06495 [Capsulimonadales bacterium]|nr:hypothetical protein [Capsulimonadales bacterium]